VAAAGLLEDGLEQALSSSSREIIVGVNGSTGTKVVMAGCSTVRTLKGTTIVGRVDIIAPADSARSP
jgi:hypothetical protein